MAMCKAPVMRFEAPALLKKAASSDLGSLGVDAKSGIARVRSSDVDEKSSINGALSFIDAEKSINGGA